MQPVFTDPIEEQFRQHLQAFPGDVEGRLKLGAHLLNAGRSDDALAQFKVILKRQPKHQPALNGKALAHARKGEFSQALTAMRKALAGAPSEPRLWVNYGNILKDDGYPEEAISAYRKALSFDGKLVGASLGLGNCAATLGRIEEAIAAYDQALDANPLYARAFYALTLLTKARRHQIPRELTQRFENQLDAKDVSAQDAELIHVALGHVEDEANNPARAFAHFDTFNKLAMKRKRTGTQVPEDRKLAEFVNQIEATLTGLAPTEDAKVKVRPLFIVGMPRSGSTLVEQILAAHPNITTAGELTTLPRLVRDLSNYPQTLGTLDEAALRPIRASYLAELSKQANGCRWVIDKMPFNFCHAGLIARLFPSSPIVHVFRDPLDTCLSCYFHNFASGDAFTHDLTEIGRYYRAYQRLMVIWRGALSGRLHEFAYEELVANPEAESRRLVALTGEMWSDECLKFYETTGQVRTASNLQVREPIHKRALSRAKAYEEFLGPLRQALAGEAA